MESKHYVKYSIAALFVITILMYVLPRREHKGATDGPIFKIVGFKSYDLYEPNNLSSPPEGPVTPPPIQAGPSFDDLLDAIEWVESKGDPWAIGDNGNAIGAYQLSKIYVDDCNRIWRCRGGLLKRFKYADRIGKKKSREMVKMFLKHYRGTFEEMAAKHCAGPDGHNQMDEPKVKTYVEKVMKRMQDGNIHEDPIEANNVN